MVSVRYIEGQCNWKTKPKEHYENRNSESKQQGKYRKRIRVGGKRKKLNIEIRRKSSLYLIMALQRSKGDKKYSHPMIKR